MPADRRPRGRPARRRHTDPLDERRRRLERLWALVLRRFTDAAEGQADTSDEEHDDRP